MHRPIREAGRRCVAGDHLDQLALGDRDVGCECLHDRGCVRIRLFLDDLSAGEPPDVGLGRVERQSARRSPPAEAQEHDDSISYGQEFMRLDAGLGDVLRDAREESRHLAGASVDPL